jgi:DNA-binding CsgD family transcriptional regulator
MTLDALTKREQEILAELMDGGRVPQIGKKLFISTHTVRNHLRSIFSKLSVHSQAELIAYVKEHPEVLGELGADVGEMADLEASAARNAVADERVSARIADILARSWSAKGLKEVVRVVLPLDALSEDEWRCRMSLWGREFSHPAALEPHLVRLSERRERVCERIAQAQEEGWIRTDFDADEVAKGLYSVILGAALELLRAPSEQSRLKQLHVLDAYIDSITEGD